jgi:hypothetical protein
MSFQIQLSIQADLMTRGMGFGAPSWRNFVLARVSVNCHALARREGACAANAE